MSKKNTRFHFKKFSIDHSKATMKVGTDGVLLGAWVNVEGANHILDIGTGSGVIALMLAQRSAATAQIDAVEVEQTDAEQAYENVLHSPWPGKVNVHCMAIQNFDPGKRYDLIVSNPPYFINSFEPPDKRRHHARHTTLLNFKEMLIAANRLLMPEGKFNVILPFIEGIQFITEAKSLLLHCTRQTVFRTRQEKPIERLLLEFSFNESPCEKNEILLYAKGEEWSEKYKELTKAFYLKL